MHSQIFGAGLTRGDRRRRRGRLRRVRWAGKDIKQFSRSVGEGLRADRERALLCVGYETLARRGELVVLQIADIEFWPNGTGQALIRRGKTDAEGRGGWRFFRVRR
jgi:integrase/recombinase XerD